MPRDVEVIGVRELQRAMGGLPRKLQRRALRKALNAAGTPVVRRARQLVAVEDGDLRRSLGKRVKIAKTPAQGGTTIVGPRRTYPGKPADKTPANYAHLVEDGAAAHAITGQLFVIPEGEADSVFADSSFIRGTINHPGALAQPFLKPAYDQTKAAAFARLREKLGSSIEQLARQGANA